MGEPGISGNISDPSISGNLLHPSGISLYPKPCPARQQIPHPSKTLGLGSIPPFPGNRKSWNVPGDPSQIPKFPFQEGFSSFLLSGAGKAHPSPFPNGKKKWGNFSLFPFFSPFPPHFPHFSLPFSVLFNAFPTFFFPLALGSGWIWYLGSSRKAGNDKSKLFPKYF